jgi:hypothetical protein
VLNEVVNGGKALTEKHLGVEQCAGDLAYVAIVGIINEKTLKSKVAFRRDKGDVKMIDNVEPQGLDIGDLDVPIDFISIKVFVLE